MWEFKDYGNGSLMEKVILTDIDGVVPDWETAFYEWMKSKGFDTKNEGIYNMEDVFEMRKR